MADRKEFTIKINGLDKSYEGAVKLGDALKQLETSAANLSDNILQTEKSISSGQNAMQSLSTSVDGLGKNIENVSKNISNLTEVMQESNDVEVNMSTNIAETSTTIIDMSTTINEAAQEVKKKKSAIEELSESMSRFGEDMGNAIGIMVDMTTLLTIGGKASAIFSSETDTTREAMESIAKITAIVNTLQTINNTVFKEGSLISKAFSLAERVRATAMNISTGATTASSVAMNLFSKALIASGVGAIIVALGYLAANFDKVKEAILKMFPGLSKMNEYFDDFKEVAAGVANVLINVVGGAIKMISVAMIKLLQRDYLGAVKEVTEVFKNEIDVMGVYEKGALEQSARNVKDNKKRIAKLRAGELDDYIKDNEAKTGSDWKYSEEGIKAYKQLFEEKKIMLQDDSAALKEAHREEMSYLRELEEFRKPKPTGSGKSDKQKALDDYKKALEQFSSETDQIEIENAQKRIDREKEVANNMVANSKEALDKRNAAIITAYEHQTLLDQKLALDKKAAIDKEYTELIAAAKKAKQDTTQLEIEYNDRLIAFRQQCAAEEISLQEEKNNAISASNEAFANNEIKRQDSIRSKTKERITEETQLLEGQAKKIKELSTDIVSRSGKMQLIDIDKTKENLTIVKNELESYLSKLNTSKSQIETYYDQLIGSYKTDSKEYKDAVKAKENALGDIDGKIKQTNKDIKANNKQTTEVVSSYWKDLSEKLKGHVDNIMTGVNAVFSATKDLLKDQLNDAKEKLSEITTQYDEVVEKREESNAKIQSLEEEAKNASGGRALALQEQIGREMEANQQLANQEKALAKEKEKKEKEIAKKEKQIKRTELAQNIVQGISSTALAVTGALGNKPWGPWNIALAAIVGAMGAVQVGIMTKQLAKFEDGGLLRGKRHSQGGMRIEGSNIEVEGGEYVVNRESTSRNLGLVRYINSERRELKPADLDSFFSRSSRGFEPSFSRIMQNGGQLPVAEPTNNIDNETLVQAIRSIRIEPRVAVSDIHRVQDSMVSVDSWTGV